MDIISLINIINANECLQNKSFTKNWSRFLIQILECLGPYPSKNKIIGLGRYLSYIFSKGSDISEKKGNNKAQSDVSSSGNAWSRLINWYLNICLIGTNCWAVNNSALIPDKLKNALQLRISGEKVQNSKEILVIGYNGGQLTEINLPNDVYGINIKGTYDNVIKTFLKNIQLDDLKVVLLSAKTNCSDMIAIPLFWNFCYKGNNINNIFSIEIGTEKENPEMLIGSRVFYSIVTIPSGREEKIKAGEIPGKAACNKLSLLDGGFYWGRSETKSIKSFDSFIKDNFNDFASDAGKQLSENFEYIRYQRSIYYKLFNIDRLCQKEKS